MTRDAISVLYTCRNSIYLELGFDCWGIERDASRYEGPGPIIAHPPCGHWSHYRHVCRQRGRDLAPLAVEQVRRFGGVLEHPARSHLFPHCGLPIPGSQPDLWGGQTLWLNQGAFGHYAMKPTKLYVVGVPGSIRILPPHTAPTYLRASHLSYARRARTPLRFALLLLAIASQIER